MVMHARDIFTSAIEISFEIFILTTYISSYNTIEVSVEILHLPCAYGVIEISIEIFVLTM